MSNHINRITTFARQNTQFNHSCLDRGQNRLLLKSISLLVMTYLLTDQAAAVPDNVKILHNIGSQIMPYLQWMVTLGGGLIGSINCWRLFNGQPKAGIYALGGLMVSGFGLEGLFGKGIATLMIP
jgi:hypothetical protein